jgi:hypothetical protein
MADGTMGAEKNEHRLRRQFEAIERWLPVGKRTIRAMRERRYRLVRIPLALVLIPGGLLGFLPVLGFWMLPVGLLLLAVDVPAMRPAISAALIRGRRRVELWRRRWWRSGAG